MPESLTVIAFIFKLLLSFTSVNFDDDVSIFDDSLKIQLFSNTFEARGILQRRFTVSVSSTRMVSV
jgi:hypothetical protein